MTVFQRFCQTAKYVREKEEGKEEHQNGWKFGKGDLLSYYLFFMEYLHLNI